MFDGIKNKTCGGVSPASQAEASVRRRKEVQALRKKSTVRQPDRTDCAYSPYSLAAGLYGLYAQSIRFLPEFSLFPGGKDEKKPPGFPTFSANV